MKIIGVSQILIFIVGISTAFGNTPPKISGINCRFVNGAYQTEMLFGEKLCLTFCTNDEDEADSVFLKAINLPIGSSFSVINSGAQLETGRFCFTPEKEPNVTDTIKIKIVAFNTKGLNPTETEQEIVIYVHQLADFTIDAKWENCGHVTISAQPQNKVQIQQWIFNCNGNIKIVESDVTTVQFENIKSGNASVTVAAIASNGYNPRRLKDILIENGAPFWTNNYELFQCKAEEVKVDIEDFRRPTASYQWLGFSTNEANKTFSRENDTTYSVLGTVGDCTDTLNIHHNVLNLDQKFTKSHQSGSSPITVTFELNGTSEADSFAIDYGDGTSDILNPRDFPITNNYAQPNKYQPVIICYKNGVNRCSQTFAFNPIDVYPTSTNEHEIGFSIYPNPSRGIINIETDRELKNVSVYNNIGQLVLESRNTTINVSSFVQGQYLIEVELENGQRISKKILIK